MRTELENERGGGEIESDPEKIILDEPKTEHVFFDFFAKKIKKNTISPKRAQSISYGPKTEQKKLK